MCVCIVIPFILDVRLVGAPAGVTQEQGQTGFMYCIVLYSIKYVPQNSMKQNYEVFPLVLVLPL